jgi:hypothetical protein
VVTPIHLTGAQCGDHVYHQGAYVGFMHRWVSGGVSVTLGDAADPTSRAMLPVAAHPFGFGAVYTDSFVVTDEEFAAGRFHWEPNPKRVEREAKAVADALAKFRAGQAAELVGGAP